MQPAGSPATSWNFADIWELCADMRGEAKTAFVHGDRRLSWAEADRRAAGVATALLDAGLGHQAKVAQYLHNCPEYLESVFASFKAGLVPANVNYRYGDDEVAYLLDDSDSEAVIFHGTFSEIVARVRPRLPKVRLWLHVADGSGPAPPFALPYEEAASLSPAGAENSVRGPWGRSPDDLYLLYTGGTTGLPKGVMWRQDDLFAVLNAGSLIRLPDDKGMEGLPQALAAFGEAPPSLLPACPLMHGTGSFTAFLCLSLGGCIVTLPEWHFDARHLLATIASEGVNLVTIVGDAFGSPMVAALDAEPGRYDLSSLLAIVSSGLMWSEQTKHGLLRHNPDMILVDVLSSSEAIGMGSSVSASGNEAETASFRLGEDARILDDEGQEVLPGFSRRGRLAVGGRLPLGYYKDEAKTAATFVTIDGRRFSIPGDFASVGEDGSVRLLGRGSAVINTGGEKVFPEEIEEVLKTHPAVGDAACVGVPDERFGEAVCALVELRAAMTAGPPELISHVQSRLAGFKVPRYVRFVGSLSRTPSGKLDYKALQELAVGSLWVRAAGGAPFGQQGLDVPASGR
jgi:acyl-CoA synthetase (AMP-forming)/AMP-acid ligase II